jgi:hypothetical protein
VADGDRVFAVWPQTGHSVLDAFDAGGDTGCAGAPKTCAPQWQAVGPLLSQPMAAYGFVYVDNGGLLDAYDAAGVQNCTGASPAICDPVWSGTGPGQSPIVSNGLVYVGGANEVDAYRPDASGCAAGSPARCSPVASYPLGSFCPSADFCSIGAVVADSDRVYAQFTDAQIMNPNQRDEFVVYFQGVIAWNIASGQPAWEQALLTGGNTPSAFGLMDVGSRIYVSGRGSPFGTAEAVDFDDELAAVDAASGAQPWLSFGVAPGIAAGDGVVFGNGGTTVCVADVGCGGATQSSPVTPLRTNDPGSHSAYSGPVIDDGVVFIGGTDAVTAFDASGATGCAGTPPTCQPFAVIALPARADAMAASNGRLYVVTDDGQLRSFAPSHF